MKVVKLNKKGYQSQHAKITIEPTVVVQNQPITIKGEGFTAFYKRGNPGIAILLDERPLTGVKLKSNGKFEIKMKMPPFKPGEHVIDAFGIQTKVTVEADAKIVTQDQLKELVLRDFNVDPDAHLLFSDMKYRACPINELTCYLGKSDVPYKKYVAEWFDCDDFSDALHGQFTFDTYPKGYAHGEIWVEMSGGGGHAINCWLVQEDDGTLKMILVEPQSGKIFDFPGSWKAFMIKI